MILNFEDVEF